MKHARTLWTAIGLAACLAGVLVWITRSANETTAAPGTAAARSAPSARALANAAALAEAAHQAAPEEVRRVARGRLRGRFLDFHSGEPVEGAIYHARHEKGVSRSDEQGEFDAFFSGAALQFEAGADGYCVVRGVISAELVDARGALEIPLVKSSPILGVVVGDDGSSVSRPYVYTIEPSGSEVTNPVPDGYPTGWSLYPEGLGGLVGSDEGRFELAGLVPGSRGYTLHVTHTGYRRSVRELAVRAAGVPTVVDVLLPRLKEPPAGSISGRTFLNGEPVMASLWFVQNRRWLSAHSETADGAYLFKRVPPGPGRLVARPSDWMIQGEAGAPDAPWIQGGQIELVVIDGVEIVQDVPMQVPIKAISGRVSVTAGSPERELYEVFAISELVWVFGEVDAEGRYAIEVPVTGHEYRIHAGNEIVAPVSDPVAPGTAGVDLAFDVAATFTLQAVDAETGDALTNPGVQLRRSGAGEDWFQAHGPPYEAPLGPLDIRVRASRHEVTVIQVHVGIGDGNHFVAELKAR